MSSVKFSKSEVMSKYHGFDGKEILFFKEEGVYAVSAEKLKQLVEDFPKNFAKASEKEASAADSDKAKSDDKIVKGNKKAGAEAAELEKAEKAVSEAEGNLKKANASLDAAEGRQRGPATIKAKKAAKVYKEVADARDKLRAAILAG